jgi:acyl-CoA synthetase (AMP-forming)/AMP-acid ligase II
MEVREYYLDLFKSFGNKPAIIHDNSNYTYKDLHTNIEKSVELLRSNGISNGDIVVLVSDYSFEGISLLFALHRLETIIVPITTQNNVEIEERLKIIGFCKIYNARTAQTTTRNGDKQHSLIQEIIDTNQSGLVLFSSGSSGKPKAMLHNLDLLLSSFVERKEKDLVFLVFLMFDHIGGLNTLLNCVAMGATIVIPQNRNPITIGELIQTYKINVLPTSPTFLNLMLISNVYNLFDLRSLKLITYGTESMPEGLLNKLKIEFKGIKFLQTFGTSETGIFKSFSKSSDSTLLRFDDPNQEFKIVNEELWIKSKIQILGYLNHHMENFTNDGWFKTGDIVKIIDDNFIKIIGRKTDIINVGGEKVYPSEIESILLTLPFISECIAFGLPNPITGQTVGVKIILSESLAFPLVKKQIKNICIANLDRYKIPTKILIADVIEHTDRFKKIRTKINDNPI